MHMKVTQPGSVLPVLLEVEITPAQLAMIHHILNTPQECWDSSGDCGPGYYPHPVDVNCIERPRDEEVH